MFVSAPYDHRGPGDPIYRITPTGQASIFYQSPPGQLDLLTNGIAFGKGNGFGNELYIQDAEHGNLSRIAPDGTRLSFGSGVTAGDFEDDLLISGGGPFGNYAYMTNAFGGEIRRMSPAGVSELFATGLSGIALAFGEGIFGENLYIGTGNGEIYAVESSGQATLFAGGFANRIRGLDIDGDTMWLTVAHPPGSLYKVRLIPEPSTLVLLCVGVVGLLSLPRRGFSRSHVS